MGWKLKSTKTLLASKALVQQFVEMEPCPHDRPLSERRLQVYERILNAGEFRPVTWAYATCGETNCTYRVNGKHTSVLLSKRDPLPDFHVTVEHYWCDRLTDVASLYNTFDSRLGSRTANDINMAFAATIPDARGLKPRLINFTVAAAAYAKWGDSQHSIPAAEKAELLVDAFPFAVWLREVLGDSPVSSKTYSGWFVVRQPVVTAMHATWDRLPRKAAEFWGHVRSEDAADRDDPTRVLARYLIRTVLGGGSTSGKSRGVEVAGFREVYVKCLHAWNAWRAGERTNLNYRADKPVPSVSK